MQKKVLIIGAGVAGLQMCRALKSDPKLFSVTVFERANEVGGVWRKNYVDMKVQVPRTLYEFPSYPMKKVKPGAFPTAEQVEEYIKDFTEEFNLRESIVLNRAVTKVTRRGEANGWTVETTTTGGEGGAGAVEHHEFDFVIVCTGMYSAVPNKIEIPGAKEFEAGGGKIYHSLEFDEALAKTVEGKNVVVVGCAKSAQDVAAASVSKGAKRTAMVYRDAHWGVPIRIAGLIPFQYIFLSRFGQTLVSLRKGAWPEGNHGHMRRAHKTLWPVMVPAFKVVEAIFAFQLGHYGAYSPRMDLAKDFYGYANIPQKAFLANKSKIEMIKGEIASLSPASGTTSSIAVLKTGKREIPCDVLILGTGFRKSYDVFEPEVVKALDVQEDGLYLYRHILPPNVPGLAFCGSEVATISNIATHAIQAEWIRAYLTGELRNVPSKEEQLKQIEKTKAWKRSWMPNTPSRANLVLLHQIHYHDDLLRDMGVNPSRKWFVAETFAPYRPRDYASLRA